MSSSWADFRGASNSARIRLPIAAVRGVKRVGLPLQFAAYLLLELSRVLVARVHFELGRCFVEGGLELALPRERYGEVEMSLGAVFANHDRLSIASFGFGILLLHVEGISELDQEGCIFWAALEPKAKVSFCLGILADIEQNDASSME